MIPGSWRRWFAFDSLSWTAPLLIAAVLAASMALASAPNAHPDEVDHAHAADYYRTNWLPPKFGDAAAAASYSKYGVSYLYSTELVYLLAGKWSVLVAPLVGDINLAYRLFNLALLVAIAIAFVRKPEARPLIVPLALSAQLWYVFSYFNGDAFAFAVALFTTYQITARASAFNAALDAGARIGWVKGVIALGFGLGLLLLAKRNYDVFIAFLLGYVALREVGLRAALAVAFGTALGVVWYYRAPAAVPVWLLAGAALAAGVVVILDVRPRLSDAAFRRRMAAFIAAAAVALALFLPRVAFDALIVGPSANERSNTAGMAEAVAADGFKPSQIAANSAMWGLRMRDRGTPYLKMLLAAPHWPWLTFKSTVGAYGYMNVFGADELYAATAAVYLALLALLGYASRGPQNSRARHSLIIAGVYAALLVLVSSLNSWTVDYQAQGRYLFPVFVMLGTVFADTRGRLPVALGAAAALAFVLAVYSFCDVGFALMVGI